MAKQFLTWLLIFIGITLIFQSFQPQDTEKKAATDDIVLVATEHSYYPGDIPVVEIYNNLDYSIRFPSDCPAEPLKVERYENGVWKVLSSSKGISAVCTGEVLEVAPDSLVSVDYSPWKDQLFGEIGKYRVVLEIALKDVQKSFSTEFAVEERGFFSSVTYHLFYQPIFNFLLFLTSILPHHNFGLAVIALTIIIRLILLVPNQKALKSQKSMMKLQPELEEIKRKFKGDQQRISLETMALWKKHRVNPVGGCLPLLIQLPILIALFYVIKAGFTPYQAHIVYDFLQSVDLTKVDTNFYDILDLQQVNATWLPIFVGLLQFFQMKLTFSMKKITGKGTPQSPEVIEKDTPRDPTDMLQDPLRMMNKTMLYFMPIMMAFMVATLPSAVGLYLAISTVFGVAQQLVVNKARD